MKDEDRIKIEQIPAKQCEAFDFGDDEQSLQFFKDMELLGKSLFCMDTSKNSFNLYGTSGKEQFQYIEFKI